MVQEHARSTLRTKKPHLEGTVQFGYRPGPDAVKSPFGDDTFQPRASSSKVAWSSSPLATRRPIASVINDMALRMSAEPMTATPTAFLSPSVFSTKKRPRYLCGAADDGLRTGARERRDRRPDRPDGGRASVATSRPRRGDVAAA